MAIWDGKLLEKIFSVFAKKNKNGNLGWETLGDALIPSAFKWLTGVSGLWFLLPATGAPGFGLCLRARKIYNLCCVCLIYSI